MNGLMTEIFPYGHLNLSINLCKVLLASGVSIVFLSASGDSLFCDALGGFMDLAGGGTAVF